MNQTWLAKSGLAETGGARLLLVFGGWALGAAPFAGLRGQGDVLLLTDFTDLSAPIPALDRYAELDLLAYSFGVVAAGHWLAAQPRRPARLSAVAGTLFPSDAERGIAPDLIRATAEGLSPTSFAAFARRAGLPDAAPPDLAAAKAELLATIARGPAPDPGFTRIWITGRDRIIPAKAQETAWAGQPSERIDTPHCPFRPGQAWEAWL